MALWLQLRGRAALLESRKILQRFRIAMTNLRSPYQFGIVPMVDQTKDVGDKRKSALKTWERIEG